MCMWEGVGADAILYQEAPDLGPLEQRGLNTRPEPCMWEKSLLEGPVEHPLSPSLVLITCHLLLYVFFTIFSESARFAFQVQYLFGQAWQTLFILVYTVLADQFCVEFKWHSDFRVILILVLLEE